MQNNDDNNWLEGAFLAQEEYDRDKDKWKGNRKKMEDHFFSTYDTLPDTHDSHAGSYSNNSSSRVWIAILVILGFLFFCLLLSSITR
jgi:hypothetical protein